MAAIDDILDRVQDRLEEEVGTAGRFWLRSLELRSGAIEALNEMLLLVGRPTMIASQPFTIQAGTPWQTIPKGMLCITNIQGVSSEVWKYTLQDLDYLQASWGPDWEQDVGDAVAHWAPIGFNMFAVHPSVSFPQDVLISGIAYPATGAWPNANITIPFTDEFFAALDMYTAHYARFKEMGNEFSESFKMLESFMQLAGSMTTLQDRRDPYIFNRAVGAQLQTNPISRR